MICLEVEDEEGATKGLEVPRSLGMSRTEAERARGTEPPRGSHPLNSVEVSSPPCMFEVARARASRKRSCPGGARSELAVPTRKRSWPTAPK